MADKSNLSLIHTENVGISLDQIDIIIIIICTLNSLFTTSETHLLVIWHFFKTNVKKLHNPILSAPRESTDI